MGTERDKETTLLREQPSRPLRAGWRSLVLWIGVPLVLFLSLEMLVRKLDRGSFARATWYEGASDRFQQGPIDFLFIGTSRTASGFVDSVWEDEIEKATGREVVALNLGRAYSGAASHYFAMRELQRRYPDKMRACTVCIEMSAGIPSFNDTWNDPWFFEGNSQLVVDYMDRSDLRRFLATPQHSFEEKAGVTARYLARGSALASSRRRLQQTIEWNGLRFVGSIITALNKGNAVIQEDLPENRQLRVDAGGIKLQRELIMDRVRPEALAAQQPMPPWEESVLCQMAAELRAAGVRVLFHDVPVPSSVWTANSTPVRLADRAAFDRWAASLQIQKLDSGMTFDDADFPDLSHLRKSRIDEYSRALARRYLELPETGQE